MKNTVCMIIPVYKEKLSASEERNVLWNIEKAIPMKIFFVGPRFLNLKYYKNKFPSCEFIGFADDYFRNIQSYNRLMLEPFFYQRFQKFEYMCICQPDALILGDYSKLCKIIKISFDYWGAPWYPSHEVRLYSSENEMISYFIDLYLKPYKIETGNGGLSLRHIEHTVRLLQKHFLIRKLWNQNEDYFFAIIGGWRDKKYRVAPRDKAMIFALETKAKTLIYNKKYLPYGIHAYEIYYPEIMQEIMNGKMSNL